MIAVKALNCDLHCTLVYITEVVDCDGFYCYNEGTCQGKTCTCADGFTGTYCETSKYPLYIL